MNRSSYTEDYTKEWRAILWRGAVASAIRGKRGQQFLRELIETLDTMPKKRLIAGVLRDRNGLVVTSVAARWCAVDAKETGDIGAAAPGGEHAENFRFADAA